MTHSLKPYRDYKDTGEPSFSRIPSQWDIQRNGRLFEQRIQNGFAELPILEVSLRTGVRVRDMENGTRKQVMSDRAKYKRAVAGDIAYNMMRMWQGAVGVVPQDGLISPAYVVARPHAGTETRYFSYLYRTDAYKAEIDAFSRGIVKDRNRLYWEDFKRMPVCVPPTDEQREIGAFLDAHAAKVRRFIRNRRRLIEVLNEQKRAVVTRCIAEQSASHPKRVHSGIAWLDDVPEHWDALKIKRVARLNPSRSESVRHRTSDAPVVFLPMEKVSVVGQVDMSVERPVKDVWQGFTYFKRGDVVIAKITPCFENGKGACLTELRTEFGFGTTEFIVLRPTQAVLAEYLYQLTMLPEFRLGGVESMTGAAGQQRVSPDFVANFLVPVPPKHEQEKIVARIGNETAALMTAISRIEKEIDLIQEYRTRLIADVVTGKIDVRGLAPAEPDSSEEPLDDVFDEGELEDAEDELVEEAASE